MNINTLTHLCLCYWYSLLMAKMFFWDQVSYERGSVNMYFVTDRRGGDQLWALWSVQKIRQGHPQLG